MMITAGTGGGCIIEEDEGKLCRVCLNSVKLNFSLFEPYLNFTPCDVISQLIDAKIRLDDNLPSAICQNCLSELEIIVKFKRKYEQSDSYLRSKVVPKSSEATVKRERLMQEKGEDENRDFVLPGSELDASCDDYLSIALNALNSAVAGNSQYKTVHKSATSKVQCNVCQQMFNTKLKLKMHRRRCHKPKSYTCTKCKRVFKSSNSFKNHNLLKESCTKYLENITIQGVGRNRIFCCVFCEYRSCIIERLKAHIVKHTGDKPFECKICKKSYTQKNSLMLHQQNKHPDSNTEAVTCHVCAKSIRGKYKYVTHLRRVHGKAQYQCDICKLFVKSKTSLICHLKKHANLRQYVCDICGESFNVASDLRNHKRRRHEGIFFSCTQCGYRAKKKLSLHKHSLLHSNEKLSQCPQCYRFYECPLKLHKHIKNCHDKHTGTLYYCPICSKCFARKDHCSVHEKRHKIS